ncbi:MAG: diguanylate cyclase [Caulobacteraceae bacterium]|nr:diguanylate cyclase [Caulobacteraceae bacterium]
MLDGATKTPGSSPGETYCRFLSGYARAGAVAVVAVGVVVLAGWVLDLHALKSVLPGLATMKVNAACAFIFAGTSLWLSKTSAANSRGLLIGLLLAGVVFLIGAASLTEDLFRIDLHIDQLLMRDDPTPARTPHPGRMSPSSAACFALVGVALLFLRAGPPGLRARAGWLAVPAMILSFLALMGYAYGVREFYDVTRYTAVALHSAAALLVLSTATLAANTNFDFTRIACSETAGGLLARRLMPILPPAMFALGWLRLTGQRAGCYDNEFGVCLSVLSCTAVSLGAIVWAAIALHEMDTKRQAAEADIRRVNQNLETKVDERTHQLAEANHLLQQLSLEDALTAIPNRRHFDLYLESQAALRRRTGKPLSLVLFDVDNFKPFNDFNGHQAGDTCLKTIAAAIRSCCRRPTDMVARYGGEEFVMVLPDTDLAAAARLAERARETVAALHIFHGGCEAAPIVTMSGGVATMTTGANSATAQLIQAADEALYSAKSAGRNLVVPPPAAIETAVVSRLADYRGAARQMAG